jgi:hypothetical protein
MAKPDIVSRLYVLAQVAEIGISPLDRQRVATAAQDAGGRNPVPSALGRVGHSEMLH